MLYNTAVQGGCSLCNLTKLTLPHNGAPVAPGHKVPSKPCCFFRLMSEKQICKKDILNRPNRLEMGLSPQINMLQLHSNYSLACGRVEGWCRSVSADVAHVVLWHEGYKNVILGATISIIWHTGDKYIIALVTFWLWPVIILKLIWLLFHCLWN